MTGQKVRDGGSQQNWENKIRDFDLFQPQQHEEGDGGEAASDPLLERNRAVTVIVNLSHHVGQDLKY